MFSTKYMHLDTFSDESKVATSVLEAVWDNSSLLNEWYIVLGFSFRDIVQLRNYISVKLVLSYVFW